MSISAEDKAKYCTVAFYNVENFFDATDDSDTLDDDFTPRGAKKWSEERYSRKAKKIAKVIHEIGREETDKHPIIVGLAEIENDGVIEVLLRQKKLRDLPYDYVHFESPDERGIDTGLIYDTNYFKVTGSENLPLLLVDKNDRRDYTRDILYVRGNLKGEDTHIFVNHWPSRRRGAEETEHKRIQAAKTILKKIDALEDPNCNLIVMGDFNDDPTSKSIQTLMASGRFINPMEQLLSPVSGSANYKGEWNLFDQILLSHTFLNYEEGTNSFAKARIFSSKLVAEWKGKYKGNPFRTFEGRKYKGGFSDHFPVFVTLKQN